MSHFAGSLANREQLNQRFERLSGSYLTLSARVTCRACYVAGKRGDEARVIEASVWNLRQYNGTHAQRNASARRRVVNACVKHYADEHPDITLPVSGVN